MKAPFPFGVLFLSVTLCWLTGCSAPVPPHPSTGPRSPGSAGRTLSVDKVVQSPEPPGPRPLDQPGGLDAPGARPSPEEAPAYSARIGRLLPRSFVILESTEATLLVKNSRPAGSSSLFEEAIALSKLRGLLSARPSLPKAVAQQTKLRDGTAIIPLEKSLPPSEAASVIVTALSVDGVQRVRAVLGFR